MGKNKENCLDCLNSVGKDYCTMQKDMIHAKYRECDGWTQIPKVIKKPLNERSEKKIISNVGLEDENFETGFLRFIKTGGAYSIRTGKVMV